MVVGHKKSNRERFFSAPPKTSFKSWYEVLDCDFEPFEEFMPAAFFFLSIVEEFLVISLS